MTGSAILTPEDLQAPRSAADMLAWVDNAAQRFNTRQLKAEAREGKHCAKQLWEEARPMALFAHRHYSASRDVVITHVLGNQSYDGTVLDSRGKPEGIAFLEVTSAKTYEDALRMEKLSTDGTVAAAGRITAVGPRRAREAIHADSEAVSRDELIAAHLKVIRTAVEKKAENHNYSSNTALVVSVDDYLPLRDDAGAAALAELATSHLIPLLKAQSPFLLVAFEGGHRLHLEYWLRSAA